MKTEIDLDAIAIDGARLKAAREARGTSVAEMAAAVTLSREQIVAIEDGGHRPFYTPAHKLLAVRKYTTALEIPYDEVVSGPGADHTLPVPEDAPVVMMSPIDMPEPADLRLAAVERNAELRRLITLGAIALCIILAVYAKLRGTPEETAEDRSTENIEIAPARSAPVAAAPTLPDALPARSVGTGSDKAASIGNGPDLQDKNRAEPVRAEAAAKTEVPVKTEAPAKPEPAKVAATATAEGTEECAGRITGEVRSWSPAYQRKSDARLFIVSPKGGTLCVVDATGKPTLLSLKPMVGQAFAGKPPYTIRSADLQKMELFMQGLRVKVPADTDTLRLVPTTQPPPSDTDSAPEA